RSEARPSSPDGDGKARIVPDSSHALFARPFPLWKRALDVFGALTVLAIASPIMIAVAIAIKLTSPGPVLFAQKRGGLGGKPFDLYKFRSMSVDAEARKAELMKFNERSGPVFKMTHDPRVTRIGKFIRKTSLDELPQLFNVLRGDMSLVGPRPLPKSEEKDYDHWHWRRLDVKPGLTCIWQVTCRHDKDFDRWVRLDLEYIRKYSLLLDLQLLFRTIPAVLAQRGAC
ncbi:MAG TPA: sugar transferase, partial [Candidatus Hydrogenedentes bacterium]|nr:sugar transferase [Candidatus Hydrogenedentota bacterium]